MTPNNLKHLTSGHLIHPGEILLDELLARKILQQDFAGVIGVQRSQLNELLKGKRDFNADICVKVAAALNMDESIWLNLMHNYELDKAKINSREQLERIEKWKLWKSSLPLSYLKKQKITSGIIEDDIPKLEQIFGSGFVRSDPGNIIQAAPAHYRKSHKRSVNPHLLEVWKKLIAYKAQHLEAAEFDKNGFDALSNELKSIFAQNQSVLEKSVSALASHGIKLVHLPKPDQCAVEGISFWQHKNPVIGLSVTYKRIDNYAFNLFHELGHVYLHLHAQSENSFVEFEEKTKEYAEDPQEKQANKFAQDSLIDPFAWENFLLKHFKHSDDDFIQFAQQQQVHPAIVFGRFCLQMSTFKRKTRIERKLG